MTKIQRNICVAAAVVLLATAFIESQNYNGEEMALVCFLIAVGLGFFAFSKKASD